jgi:hypothetical protein
MLDIKLSNNDFTIDAGRSLALQSDSNLVLQKMYIMLKLESETYFYDSDAGFPWTSFREQKIKPNIITIYLTRYLYEISGVLKVYSLTVVNDNVKDNRDFTISGTIEDDFRKIHQLYL